MKHEMEHIGAASRERLSIAKRYEEVSDDMYFNAIVPPPFCFEYKGRFVIIFINGFESTGLKLYNSKDLVIISSRY